MLHTSHTNGFEASLISEMGKESLTEKFGLWILKHVRKVNFKKIPRYTVEEG